MLLPDPMEEYLLEAREELKRLEHIIYVSLKYTRTVDVLMNGLRRIISIYDFLILGYLEEAQSEGKVEAIPKSPARRASVLAELYAADDRIQLYLTFYRFVRLVLRLPHKKRREYRRHVTLIVELENRTAEVTTDNLVNCEKFVQGFFTYTQEKFMPATIK